MSYSKITIDEIRGKFGYQDIVTAIFPLDLTELPPTEWLKESLRLASKLRITSEKARSEAIVYPILSSLKDINHDSFTFFSGENLNVDKSNGLNGECDFIISKNAKASAIDTPIVCMVEAERNDMELGKPQCMANDWRKRI